MVLTQCQEGYFNRNVDLRNMFFQSTILFLIIRLNHCLENQLDPLIHQGTNISLMLLGSLWKLRTISQFIQSS